MTEASKIQDALKAPFDASKVSWRVGNTNAKKLGCKPWQATEGSALAYIDARDVMQRLDEVVGMNNWQCKYPFAGCCELSIRIDGEWITKSNSAGETQVEAEKGQASDAFKRAAVLFGVGQYLYDLPFIWINLNNGSISKEVKQGLSERLAKWQEKL